MTISKPILYSVLLGLVGYAALTLTGEEPPKKKAIPPKSSVKKSGEIVITEEDLKANFARYTPQPKDAFLPKVIPVGSQLDKKKGEQPVMGKWMLTGVNTVDSVTSAVLENDSTHDIQILKRGDTFNGAQVTSIEPLAVNFVNNLKQVSRLTFVEPEPTKESAVTPAPAASANPFAAAFAAMSGGGGGTGRGMQSGGGQNTMQDGATAPTDTTLEIPTTGRRGRRNRGGN